ncbi:unnamed protein product [Spirodela intermedia]|uniref:NAC domain-containing protein n=1 Tax=Spirodela intermedia TaxID=51605 RepID=A0A7I8I9Y5_SPIIN|nr:unnamed protein product [Spirodela intermedia]CAA6654526.1 unnamed protein product [Spirodela intermedia]
MMTRDAEAEINLPPGFRFHPTDEELVVHYLSCKAEKGKPPSPSSQRSSCTTTIRGSSQKALFGKREWYFFTARNRKYPNGSRPNRAAGNGYWKATGADKPITPAGSSKPLGIKKALVFYSGKAPKGVKSDWIMHEYRLVEATGKRLDDWVLCRLYHKKNNKAPTLRQDEAAERTAPAGVRTLESDVDDEPCSSHDSPCNPHGFAEATKVNDDWLLDLNIDDLQTALTAFPEAAPPHEDMSCQDYFMWDLTSPYLRPNLPTF